MSERTENHHILSAILSESWAIQPEALTGILSIASRANESPEAVATRLGRPLENSQAVTRRDATAIVPVKGPIFRYANLFTQVSGATSIQVLATDLQAAMDDPSVKSIVLEIDSPGGQVAGIAEFAAQVRAASAVKPVIAYVSDLGASAAYWIAAAASEIVASDTAMLGSIGVVMTASTGGDAKTIKFVSSQSPAKHADPSSDLGQQRYQQQVDALASVFVLQVAQYRGVDPQKVLTDFGQGGVLIGAAAVAAGMADRLGSLESILAGLSGATQQRGNTMSASNQPDALPITADTLRAQHPDVYQAVFDTGAKAERERIQGVEEQLIPGHEALIAALKFDGKTSGPEAAVKVLNAEKAARTTALDQRRADAPKPLPHAEAPLTDAPAASKKPKTAEQIAAAATRYQLEQKALGITVDDVTAVNYVLHGE
jgi:ClpP class serine protease